MSALCAVLVALAILLWPRRERALPSAGPVPTESAEVATEAGSSDVAEVARLLGAALRAGVGVVEALEVVAVEGPPAARDVLARVVAAHRWGSSAREAWAPAGPVWEPVATALVVAESAGLSPVRALAVAADRVERDRASRTTAVLGRLEVLVVLPLGLAFLPGFVLTTVVPVVVGLVRSSLP